MQNEYNRDEKTSTRQDLEGRRRYCNSLSSGETRRPVLLISRERDGNETSASASEAAPRNQALIWSICTSIGFPFWSGDSEREEKKQFLDDLREVGYKLPWNLFWRLQAPRRDTAFEPELVNRTKEIEETSTSFAISVKNNELWRRPYELLQENENVRKHRYEQSHLITVKTDSHHRCWSIGSLGNCRSFVLHSFNFCKLCFKLGSFWASLLVKAPLWIKIWFSLITFFKPPEIPPSSPQRTGNSRFHVLIHSSRDLYGILSELPPDYRIALVRYQDEHGITALHLAASQGSENLHFLPFWFQGYHDRVCLLVDAGADITAKDLNGNLPLDLAAMSGRTSVVVGAPCLPSRVVLLIICQNFWIVHVNWENESHQKNIARMPFVSRDRDLSDASPLVRRRSNFLYFLPVPYSSNSKNEITIVIDSIEEFLRVLYENRVLEFPVRLLCPNWVARSIWWFIGNCWLPQWIIGLSQDFSGLITKQLSLNEKNQISPWVNHSSKHGDISHWIFISRGSPECLR